MIKSCSLVSTLSFLILALSCRLPLAEAEDGEARAGRLLITELGAGSRESGSSWFEIYNASTETAELSRYLLRTCWKPRGMEAPALRESLELPELAIPPGAYALVCGAPQGSDSYTVGNIVYLCLRSFHVPDWSDSGFEDIELLLDGATADFVRFGESRAAPASARAWAESGALPALDPGLAESLGREGSNADSDSAADWSLRLCPTPGGANDVTELADRDADGLPDASESPEGSFAGLKLSDWGAGADKPDIFIQLDYMASEDPGIRPQREALEKVVQAFANHGIRLHIDAGRLFHPGPGPSPADFDLDDRSHEVAYAPKVTIGGRPGYADLYGYKNASMELARKQIFHYVLFGSSQDSRGGPGSSGLAEFRGNDFMVSLGAWGLSAETETERAMLVNFQASTLMHELGHNLGLLHGGADNANYKPNYLSIMNYLYQLTGLPPGGEGEGDRYYYENAPREYLGGRYWGIESLKGGPGSAEFRLDFSEGRAETLHEAAVAEPRGLGIREAGSSQWVDFDLDGDNDEVSYAQDLNPHCRKRSGEALEDCDDWSLLELDAMLGLRPDFVGPPLSRSFRLLADPAFHDVQELVEEPPVRLAR